MNITGKFLTFALLGAEWVMWLLVALSIVSVAIMIERWRTFAGRRVDFEALAADLRGFLSRADVEGAVRKYGASNAIEVVVGVSGLKEAERGAEAAAEAMASARIRGRLDLERNLAFLGTLGNNAPFIGLFGTVLGIIKAFSDLAENSQAGAQTVMRGISEALVATALGLLVALPAVVSFNVFQRQVRGAVARSEALARQLLAELRGRERGAAGARGSAA